MKTFRLWLLKRFEKSLAAQVRDLEESVAQQRRLLILAHRDLRQIRAKIGQLTPPDQLMREVGQEQPGRRLLASRQPNVYRSR